MKNKTLLKILQQLNLKSAAKPSQHLKGQSPDESNSGFTLIELIVVVIIIAVLSAIAAPGWLAFVNRQRVNKVNDTVFSAIQQAQREAKRTKLSYSVSFRTTPDKVMQFAVYPTKKPDPANAGATIDVNPYTDSNFNGWKSLSDSLDIKPGQVLLLTNINGTNQADKSPHDTGTITFDYKGNLPNEANLGNNQGLIVSVAVARSDQPTQPITATQRCVVVKTLLGSMEIGPTQQNPNQCNPS